MRYIRPGITVFQKRWRMQKSFLLVKTHSSMSWRRPVFSAMGLWGGAQGGRAFVGSNANAWRRWSCTPPPTPTAPVNLRSFNVVLAIAGSPPNINSLQLKHSPQPTSIDIGLYDYCYYFSKRNRCVELTYGCVVLLIRRAT